MRRLAAPLLALPLLFGCNATHGYRVHHVKEDAKTLDVRSVLYALPRTVVSVSIPVTRTTTEAPPRCTKQAIVAELEASQASSAAPADLGAKKGANPGIAPERKPAAGKFEEEADRMLAAVLVSQAAPPASGKRIFIELGAPEITTRQEVDPEQIYAIELDEHFMVNSKRGISLSGDGFLTGASLESQNVAVDASMKILGTSVDIAARILGFGGPASEEGGRCRRAAEEIEKLRQARLAIIKGQGQTNGSPKEALEFFLNELRAQEKLLLAEFTGKQIVEQSTVLCELVPVSRSTDLAAFAQAFPLFALDSSAGFYGVDKGCVVHESLVLKEKPAKSEDIVVRLETYDLGLANAARKVMPERTDPSGIVYRIPADAVVRLLAGTTELSRGRYKIAQYGTTAVLPGDVDGEAGQAALAYAVRLDPTSGALLDVSSTATSVDASPVESLGGTVTKALDAVKGRQEAQENADVNALEKEKKRLELLRDIGNLQKELSGAPRR